MGEYPGLVKFVECPERRRTKRHRGLIVRGPLREDGPHSGIGDAASKMDCLEGSGWVRTGVGVNSLLR